MKQAPVPDQTGTKPPWQCWSWTTPHNSRTLKLIEFLLLSPLAENYWHFVPLVSYWISLDMQELICLCTRMYPAMYLRSEALFVMGPVCVYSDGPAGTVREITLPAITPLPCARKHNCRITTISCSGAERHTNEYLFGAAVHESSQFNLLATSSPNKPSIGPYTSTQHKPPSHAQLVKTPLWQ